MRVIRRTQIGAAAAAVALSGMFFAPAAMAATPAHSAAVVAPVQYSNPAPGGSATVTVSGSVVAQGDNFTVTINGVPGRVYSATVFSTPKFLGTKAADSTGKVSFTFSTKDLPAGDHRVEVTDTVTGKVATAYFSVTPATAGTASDGTSNQAGGTSNQAGGSDSGSGALAFTGAEAVIPLSVLGVILVGGGAAAVVASRSRKASSNV